MVEQGAPADAGPIVAPGGVRAGMLLLGVVLLLIYGRALGYGFVWDDTIAIRDNPNYTGSVLSGLTATQHDHLGVDLHKLAAEAGHDSFRPLLFLSHRLDVALFGMRPGPMHAHNVALGALAVALAYLLALRLVLDPMLALLAAAIFALHPMQVEAVTYISGRGDLLAATFGFASALLCLRAAEQPARSPRRTRAVLAACLCLLASLFSKEAYIGLPAACGLLLWSRGQLRGQASVPGAMLLALLGYLGLRVAVAGSGTGVSPIDGVVALPGVVLDYLLAALSPFDLSTERLFDPSLITAGWGLLSSVAAIGVWAARRPMTPAMASVRGAVAAYGWCFLLVGPSALIVLVHGVVADRYFYLPLFGFGMLLVGGLQAGASFAPTTRRPLRVVLGLTLLLWAAVDMHQVTIWRDGFTLYSHAVRFSPKGSMAHYRLGYMEARAGRCDLAIPRFKRALQLDEHNIRARNNLGFCLLNTGDPGGAATVLREVVARAPWHTSALFNLGMAAEALGDVRQACQSFDGALELDPGYDRARAASTRLCRPPDGKPAGGPATPPPRDQVTE